MTRYGWNVAYVDELYQQYLADPDSVSEAWREFFADYRPEAAAGAPPRAAGQSPGPTESRAEVLRGAAARLARHMTESLGIPTASSLRTIPVKLLEENRRLINQHQKAVAGPKVSFTHVIAWAIVRALERHPALNASYEERDGEPHRVPRSAVHLGLAVDVERRGERMLVVPNIKNAQALDFPSFVAAYDDLVARARNGTLRVEDLQGTTVTLTNPGTIGTGMSVPRLMPGQGAIFGIGSIDYPAAYRGMAPETIGQLGLSKVMTVTSTYDHRIIQGAESGAFLATLESLLVGAEGFYDRIFAELGVPHEPVRWSADRAPQGLGPSDTLEAIEKQARVLQLIRTYRARGHLLADTDPLHRPQGSYPELELSHYGLSLWDLDRKFITGGLAGRFGMATLREILDTLRETYCRYVGVEYMHIQEPEIRFWLQERLEDSRSREPLPRETQLRILEKLNAAEAFERFLHTTYVGHKRFSLEGAEALIPMLDALCERAAALEVDEIVFGMAHRGRLNVLANIVGVSYEQIFREFEDVDPFTAHGSGDVKYHLGATGRYVAPDGREVRLVVSSNPSHLEAVDPVVVGRVRARQDRAGDAERVRILPVLIHGDAAVAGQGVVAETLHLSQLRGFRTGGTVHIVVNNQIGFTTAPADARSSRYATDVGRMVQAPIFHVNGDHPEEAVRVIRLALEFRQKFRRDVFVDLVCYRRWGHNEADDPSYTHPSLYKKIEQHRSVRKLYTEELLRRGDIDGATAERALEDFRQRLDAAFAQVKRREQERAEPRVELEPDPALELAAPDPTPTAVERGVLERVLRALETTPPGFTLHPKLRPQIERRRRLFEQGQVDFPLAEAFAFGSLVLQGVPVRLSGEDSARGTFSQRHAVFYDYETGESYTPLAQLDPGQAPFMVFDSPLSEFAVLGFEYGYSVDYPEALVLWEAQFGDFANGAQVVIDQFVASGEDKWNQPSGLVLLLPHGYEGQGPEHSSARVERFLQLAAQGNIQLCDPTTPAQYFHLLRRQARRQARKPLIVLTPKSLLRHPQARSPVEAFVAGRFVEVLDEPDPGVREAARRLVVCCGKVFYELVAARDKEQIRDVAIVRLEQLYPYPRAALRELLQHYRQLEEAVWVQEEPQNMGAWSFIRPWLEEDLPEKLRLGYVGRPPAASTATGSYARHRAEQQTLVARALAGRPAPASARSRS